MSQMVRPRGVDRSPGGLHRVPESSNRFSSSPSSRRSSRAKALITKRLPTPLRLLKVRTSPCTVSSSPAVRGPQRSSTARGATT